MAKPKIDDVINSFDDAEKIMKKLPKDGTEASILLKTQDGAEFTYTGTREDVAAVWAYKNLSESKELILTDKIVDLIKGASEKTKVKFDNVAAVLAAVKVYNMRFFRAARKKLGTNQDDIALMVGWSKQQICNVEGGTRELQIQTKLAVETLLRRADKWDEFKKEFYVVDDEKM